MLGRTFPHLGPALLGVAAIVGALGVLYAVGTWRTAQVETTDWRDLRPLPGASFLRTRTGRTHYVDVGQGPAVLLLHGSGAGLADWREGVIERLARRHRVIAFDDFGSGFSERNPEFTYGYDLWVEQAVELLQALSIPHATVIGHSVGGVLAAILAADHPQLVDHVVTIGTGMTIEPQQLLPILPGVGEVVMANAATYGRTYSPAHRAAMRAAYAVKGTRAALLAYARRQVTIDGLRLLRGTFEDIGCPVLHVGGSRDTHIPPAVARDLAKRTGGRFVSIEGVDHDVHIEAPDRLVDAVERFLAHAPGF